MRIIEPDIVCKAASRINQRTLSASSSSSTKHIASIMNSLSGAFCTIFYVYMDIFLYVIHNILFSFFSMKPKAFEKWTDAIKMVVGIKLINYLLLRIMMDLTIRMWYHCNSNMLDYVRWSKLVICKWLLRRWLVSNIYWPNIILTIEQEYCALLYISLKMFNQFISSYCSSLPNKGHTVRLPL